MSRFHDPQLVAAYRETGAFPAIHDDIAGLVRDHKGRHSVALDLGACTGLLSARLVQELGFTRVLAVEPNANYIKAGVSPTGVSWIRTAAHTNPERLGQLCRLEGVTVVVARRVFPEIEESRRGAVRELGAALADAGVELIALEGRVRVPKPSAKLSDADLEAAELAHDYELLQSRRNCRLLTRNHA